MDFILENKWLFLIIAEVVFWVSIITFLVLRYWFGFRKLSVVFFFLFIINDLWIATMGFMDYLKTGEFTSYQVVILIILVYALTYGKTDIKRLDIFIKKKVAAWRGETNLSIESPTLLYGKEHARIERKQFLLHLLVFIVVHLALLVIIGASESIKEISSLQELLNVWFNQKNSVFPFDNSSANNLSRIWTIILIIDGVTSFSYTLFPRAERKKESTN